MSNKTKIISETLERDDMTPSLLVAPPGLHQSPFDEAVIVLSGHQSDGSMGFIINHPIGLSIKDLLEENDEHDASLIERPIFFGGPVAKNSGFILYEHKKNRPLAPGININNKLSISPSRKLLEDAAKGMLPGRFELLLGYSAWNKGQLYKELSRGGWLHVPFCNEIFFDILPEERWHYSYKFLGLAPYAFMQVPGGAQA